MRRSHSPLVAQSRLAHARSSSLIPSDWRLAGVDERCEPLSNGKYFQSFLVETVLSAAPSSFSQSAHLSTSVHPSLPLSCSATPLGLVQVRCSIQLPFHDPTFKSSAHSAHAMSHSPSPRQSKPHPFQTFRRNIPFSNTQVCITGDTRVSAKRRTHTLLPPPHTWFSFYPAPPPTP